MPAEKYLRKPMNMMQKFRYILYLAHYTSIIYCAQELSSQDTMPILQDTKQDQRNNILLRNFKKLKKASTSLAQEITQRDEERSMQNEHINQYINQIRAERERQNAIIAEQEHRIAVLPYNRKIHLFNIIKTRDQERLQEDTQLKELMAEIQTRRNEENKKFISHIKELSYHADNIEKQYKEENPDQTFPLELKLHFNKIKHLTPAAVIKQIALSSPPSSIKGKN